jgi:hypothetical protein
MPKILGLLFFLVSELVAVDAVLKRRNIGSASDVAIYLLPALVAVPLAIYFGLAQRAKREPRLQGAETSSGGDLATLAATFYGVLMIVMSLLVPGRFGQVAR